MGGLKDYLGKGGGVAETPPIYYPTKPEINPDTGLPFDHKFGTVGSLREFVVRSRKGIRNSPQEMNKKYYIIGVVLLVLVLFWKKIKSLLF